MISSTDEDEQDNNKGNDTDEINDDADMFKESEIPESPPISEKYNIKVEVGLPDGIPPLCNRLLISISHITWNAI
jgi:hypothetical protein